MNKFEETADVKNRIHITNKGCGPSSMENWLSTSTVIRPIFNNNIKQPVKKKLKRYAMA